MKAPRCRLCGKEHYGLCREAAKRVVLPPKKEGSVKPSVVRAAVRAVKKPTTPSAMPRVQLHSQSLTEMGEDVLRDIAGMPELQEEIRKTIPPVRVKNPFTPAQKQKAYRARGGDELRERERLRKAAKRKEL